VACAAGKYAAAGDSGLTEDPASVCQPNTCTLTNFAVNPWTRACEACPAWMKVKPTQTSGNNALASNIANKITFGGAHGFVTGNKVLYTQGTALTPITGLTSGTEYYALKLAANDLQLSSTAPVTVTDVTKVNGCVVTTSTDHGFKNGDTVAFNPGNLADGGGNNMGTLIKAATYAVSFHRKDVQTGYSRYQRRRY
jgi:hypothetical protein